MIEHKLFNTLKDLQEELHNYDVPEGWKSTEQLASEWGVSKTTASRLIKKGLKAGILEHEKFLVKSPIRQHRLSHFKEVE